MRISREELLEKKRPKRVPVSGNRDILSTSVLPDHLVARWVNDKEDRIARFLLGGWEFVTDAGVTVGEKTVEASKGIGTVVHRLVGHNPHTRNPMYAYLMVIDKELYAEDQLNKEREISLTEKGLYENPHRQGSDKYNYGSLKNDQLQSRIT